MNSDEFLATAERYFAVLCSEFGLIVVRRSNRAPEAWLKMQNATTAVTIHLEIGGKPWLSLSAIDPGSDEAVAGDAYDLAFLLEERAPQALVLLQNAQDVEEVVELQAKYARTYGQDILAGDFSVFPRLRKRAEKALRRSEAQLEGDEG